MRIPISESFSVFLTQRMQATKAAEESRDHKQSLLDAAEHAVVLERTSFSQIINAIAVEHKAGAFDPTRVEVGRDAEGYCVVLHDPPKEE